MKNGNMFWLYVMVAVLTGINLLTLPLMLVPLVWGMTFSVMFICANYLSVKYKLWLGIFWLLGSAIVGVYIFNGRDLSVEMRITVSMFSCFSCIWYACKEYLSKITK